MLILIEEKILKEIIAFSEVDLPNASGPDVPLNDIDALHLGHEFRDMVVRIDDRGFEQPRRGNRRRVLLSECEDAHSRSGQ